MTIQKEHHMSKDQIMEKLNKIKVEIQSLQSHIAGGPGALISETVVGSKSDKRIRKQMRKLTNLILDFDIECGEKL